MQLKKAISITTQVCYKLQPFCIKERLRIAGSVRRMKPEPGDIEIVCLPLIEMQKNLFGDYFGAIRSREFTDMVNSLGRTIKGTALGKYMQIELPEGINLDLFMPAPEDYFRIFVIRTGSAEYVRDQIAAAWKIEGWCGSDKGFRKVTDCVQHIGPDGKGKWKCVAPKPELPPIWDSEEYFFDWLGVKMIHPSKRVQRDLYNKYK